MRRAAELLVERRAIDGRAGRAEIGHADRLGELGNVGLRRRRARVALSDHHPADIVDDRLAALIEPLRAYMDDAALPVRVLLQSDHLGNGGERVAGKNRLQEPAIGVAEVGHGVQRYVGHGLAEHDMEGEQIVDRALRVADGAREGFRALRREAAAGQCRIKRGVAARQRARRRVTDRLPQAKVFEEPACGGLGRWRSGHPTVRRRKGRRSR